MLDFPSFSYLHIFPPKKFLGIILAVPAQVIPLIILTTITDAAAKLGEVSGAAFLDSIVKRAQNVCFK
jgi:hypothetical protein